MKTAHVLLLTLIALASACNTGAGEVSCLTTQNGEQCFFPSQYQCVTDPVSGDTLLAAAGTAPCNNVLYATCAYSCDLSSGQIELRADRTCPAPPSCQSNEIGCGEACYDASTVCCINSSPVIIQECPSATAQSCDSDNACNFTLSGVGQLADGQLRQNFGAGAFEVSFSLRDGSLYDNLGQICYVTSPENQIQCNYSPQFDTTDDFCLSQSDAGQFLAYKDSTLFYACAVGTGGYNIYTSQYNGVYCQPIFVEVDSQTCPPEPQPSTSSEVDSTSSSQLATSSSDVPAPTTSSDAPAPTTSNVAPSNFPTTSSTPAPTTSSVAPSNFPTTSSVRTSSEAPSTTSAPKDTCVNNPRPLPWCYFDFDFDFDFSFQNKKTCSDRSGKGHHGNFFGNPKGSSALWKLGASFTGKGQQYISINKTADLSNTFTVATYVNFYSLGEVTLAESNTWSVKVNAKAGKIYFIGKDTISFDATFTSGVWVHIAVSIDASGNVSAFKDGRSCGRTKRTSCQKHTGSIKTCKHKGSFHGCFDEYFIFNYALTLSEIESCRNKNKDQCATVTTPAQTKSFQTTKSSSKTVQITSQAPKTTTRPITPSTTTKKHHNCGVPWVYFPCDKNQHTRCSDDSGHGNHGSWFGPTPSQCGGKIRNGLTFSGTTNQAITVSKCPLSSDFSIATWVRFQISGSSSYKLASTKGSDGASAGWELEFNANTKTINFYGASHSKASWDCSELSANSWFHLSVVVSSSSNCELFINGNSKGLKSVSRISAGGALWVANSASKNAQFKGSLDEFCVFDKALSAEQVAFARDTYTDQASTSSWSFAAAFDWGAAWEKGPLTTIKQNRIEKWWQL